MALKESKRGGNRVTTNLMGRPYFHHVSFVTQSTGVTSQTPTASCTVARSTAGTYTVTFLEECKPAVIHWATADVIHDSTFDGAYDGIYGGYVASTGVATIYGVQDGTNTATAIADTTGMTLSVVMLCNGVSKVAE